MLVGAILAPGKRGHKKMDKINRAATNKISGVDQRWISFIFDGPNSVDTTPLEGISGPGDSGGPAYLEKDGVLYVVGVSSHQQLQGHEEGRYGVREKYTKVSRYQGWLLKTMGLSRSIPKDTGYKLHKSEVLQLKHKAGSPSANISCRACYVNCWACIDFHFQVKKSSVIADRPRLLSTKLVACEEKDKYALDLITYRTL